MKRISLLLLPLIMAACGSSEKENKRLEAEAKRLTDSSAIAINKSIQKVAEEAKQTAEKDKQTAQRREESIVRIYIEDQHFPSTTAFNFDDKLTVRIARKSKNTGYLVLALIPESDLESKYATRKLTGNAILYTDAGEAVKCLQSIPEHQVNGRSVLIYDISSDGVSRLHRGNVTSVMYSTNQLSGNSSFTANSIKPINPNLIKTLFSDSIWNMK